MASQAVKDGYPIKLSPKVLTRFQRNPIFHRSQEYLENHSLSLLFSLFSDIGKTILGPILCPLCIWYKGSQSKNEIIFSRYCYWRWPFVSSLCGNVSTLIKMSIRHKKNIAAHFSGIYQGNKDKGVKQDYIEEGKTSTPTLVTFFCCHHPWPWNCPLPLKGLLRKGSVYLTSSIPTNSSISQTENILTFIFKGQGLWLWWFWKIPMPIGSVCCNISIDLFSFCGGNF